MSQPDRLATGLLRPGGRLAVFWNVGRSPDALARAFSEVYRRVLPNTPYANSPGDPLVAYEPIFTRAAGGSFTITYATVAITACRRQ